MEATAKGPPACAPGPGAPADVAKLLAAGESSERCAAAEALGGLGEAAAPHAAELAGLLHDGSEDAAATMLAKACVISMPEAIHRLPKCAAAEALPKLGAEGRAFAAAVAAMLQDGEPEVRCAAAASLGAMDAEGAAHEDAVLLLLATERDPRVISAAILALAEMGKAKGSPSAAAVDAVLRAFSSQHPGVRGSAAAALGRLGDAAPAHAARLVRCLTDRCPKVKIAALAAIANLGTPGQVYAADVARLAYDSWQLVGVRVAALEALSTMGERGEALADDIAELLNDSEDQVREAAAQALERLGALGEGWEGPGYGYGAEAMGVTTWA